MRQSFLPVSVFYEEPYSGIIAYPRPTRRTVASRLAELEKLGISGVSFRGPTRIGSVSILGKGYVGVVVAARMGSRTVALKIRRLDSQRGSMGNEASMLQLANRSGVGPRLISHSRNFLVMEYLGGKKIGDWFSEPRDRGRVRSVVRKILSDCYRLDMDGFDHGELSSISKHVIIGTKTTIIDFEKSSTRRRAANVTSAAQGIFIGSGISKRISRAYRLPRKDRIISVLRAYKSDPGRQSFEDILAVLGL